MDSITKAHAQTHNYCGRSVLLPPNGNSLSGTQHHLCSVHGQSVELRHPELPEHSTLLTQLTKESAVGVDLVLAHTHHSPPGSMLLIIAKHLAAAVFVPATTGIDHLLAKVEATAESPWMTGGWNPVDPQVFAVASKGKLQIVECGRLSSESNNAKGARMLCSLQLGDTAGTIAKPPPLLCWLPCGKRLLLSQGSSHEIVAWQLPGTGGATGEDSWSPGVVSHRRQLLGLGGPFRCLQPGPHGSLLTTSDAQMTISHPLQMLHSGGSETTGGIPDHASAHGQGPSITRNMAATATTSASLASDPCSSQGLWDLTGQLQRKGQDTLFETLRTVAVTEPSSHVDQKDVTWPDEPPSVCTATSVQQPSSPEDAGCSYAGDSVQSSEHSVESRARVISSSSQSEIVDLRGRWKSEGCEAASVSRASMIGHDLQLLLGDPDTQQDARDASRVSDLPGALDFRIQSSSDERGGMCLDTIPEGELSQGVQKGSFKSYAAKTAGGNTVKNVTPVYAGRASKGAGVTEVLGGRWGGGPDAVPAHFLVSHLVPEPEPAQLGVLWADDITGSSIARTASTMVGSQSALHGACGDRQGPIESKAQDAALMYNEQGMRSINLPLARPDIIRSSGATVAVASSVVRPLVLLYRVTRKEGLVLVRTVVLDGSVGQAGSWMQPERSRMRGVHLVDGGGGGPVQLRVLFSTPSNTVDPSPAAIFRPLQKNLSPMDLHLASYNIFLTEQGTTAGTMAVASSGEGSSGKLHARPAIPVAASEDSKVGSRSAAAAAGYLREGHDAGAEMGSPEAGSCIRLEAGARSQARQQAGGIQADAEAPMTSSTTAELDRNSAHPLHPDGAAWQTEQGTCGADGRVHITGRFAQRSRAAAAGPCGREAVGQARSLDDMALAVLGALKELQAHMDQRFDVIEQQLLQQDARIGHLEHVVVKAVSKE